MKPQAKTNGQANGHANGHTNGHANANGNGHKNGGTKTVTTLSESVAHFQADAPTCPNCGHMRINSRRSLPTPNFLMRYSLRLMPSFGISGLARYFAFYSHTRLHQPLGYRNPAAVYATLLPRI